MNQSSVSVHIWKHSLLLVIFGLSKLAHLLPYKKWDGACCSRVHRRRKRKGRWGTGRRWGGTSPSKFQVRGTFPSKNKSWRKKEKKEDWGRLSYVDIQQHQFCTLMGILCQNFLNLCLNGSLFSRKIANWIDWFSTKLVQKAYTKSGELSMKITIFPTSEGAHPPLLTPLACASHFIIPRRWICPSPPKFLGFRRHWHSEVLLCNNSYTDLLVSAVK